MLSRPMIAFVASAFVAFVSAQSSSASGSASGSGDSSTPTSQSMAPVATQGVNVANITAADKQHYCLAQRNSCPEICDGKISQNRCDEPTLQFQCVCLNGTVPDLTVYKNTIPYFECQENYKQCVNSHPNDLDGQTTCKNNMQCGSLEVESPSASTSSSSSGSSATSSSPSNLETIPSGTGAEASATSSGSSSQTGAANSLLREEVGMSVFAATVLAALKFLL